MSTIELTLTAVAVIMFAALIGFGRLAYRNHVLRAELADQQEIADQEKRLAKYHCGCEAEMRKHADELREKIDQLVKDKAALADQADRANKWSALQSAERALIWRKPAEEMTELEVKKAFAVSSDAPFWRALHQVLEERIFGGVDAMTVRPGNAYSEAERLHAAGGVEELREFQKELLTRHRAATRADADLEGEGAEPATRQGRVA